MQEARFWGDLVPVVCAAVRIPLPSVEREQEKGAGRIAYPADVCHPVSLHKNHSKTKTSQTRPLFDCSGNRLADPTIVSKVAIESAMNAMTSIDQAAISPRQKWAAVDLHQAGRIEEALALLSQSVGLALGRPAPG